MAEHSLPWVYRPLKHDDWGFIRDAAGDLAACARGDKGNRSHDGHRAAGTDPYGEYAAFIVKAVNNHDALVRALRAAERIVADRVAGGRMLTNKEDAETAWLLCKEALAGPVGSPLTD